MSDNERFTRRIFLVGISGLIIAGTALYFDKKYNIATTLESLFKSLGNQFPEVVQLYPELGNLRVSGEGTFLVTDTNIRWFNFSDVDFKPEVAKSLYSFLDSVPRQEGDQMVDYKIDGIDEKLLLYQMEFNKNAGTVFIIPGEAPFPSWIELDKNTHILSFTKSAPDGSFINVIKVPKTVTRGFFGDSIQTLLTTAFTTEACHSEIWIIPATVALDDSERKFRVWSIGQEVICNSFGFAVWRKQEGDTYEEYVSLANESKIKPGPKGQDYQLVVFPDETYSRIPKERFIVAN